MYLIVFLTVIGVLGILAPTVPHIIEYYSWKDLGDDFYEHRQNELVFIKKRIVSAISLVLVILIPELLIFSDMSYYIKIPLFIFSVSLMPLVLKLFEVNIGIFGRKKYKRNAKKRAADMRYSEPVITCDSCGSDIDTSLYKVCPHCGAAYDIDKEWQSRHAVDTDSEYSDADEYVEKQFKESKKASEKTIKEIKRALIHIAVFVVFCVALVLLVYFGSDEVPDKNIFQTQTAETVSYTSTVSGDNVVFDCELAKVSIVGFRKSENDTHKTVVDFLVENKTGKELRIHIRCEGVNYSLSEYPETIYLFHDGQEKTSELSDEISVSKWDIVRNISLRLEDIYDENDMILDNDTAENKYPSKQFITNEGEKFKGFSTYFGSNMYSENGLNVFRTTDYNNRILLIFKNESDKEFYIIPYSLKVNGAETSFKTMPFDVISVPPEYYYTCANTDSYQLYEKSEDSDSVEISFIYSDTSFDNPDKERKQYNTDYIEISD